MTTKVRRTASNGREELDQLWAARNSLMMFVALSAQNLTGAIADGGTDGKLQNIGTVTFRIGRGAYTKAATDNLWDLSAQVDTTSTQYRAVWLLLDAGGTASIAAGANAATAADALRALPELDGTKAVAGVYVADPSCDFNGADGLAAQGTIYDGIPDGVPCNVPRQTYTIPSVISLVPA